MRVRLTVGNRVKSSTLTNEIGRIVDKNSFGEVLIEWPDGKRNWSKRRHLLRIEDEKTTAEMGAP